MANLVSTNENIFGNLEGQYPQMDQGLNDWSRQAANQTSGLADEANRGYEESYNKNAAEMSKIKATIADYNNADQRLNATNQQVTDMVNKEYGNMGRPVAEFNPLQKTEAKEQQMSVAANLNKISSQMATQKLQKSVSRYGFDLDVYKSYQNLIENDRQFYANLQLQREEFDNKVKMQEAEEDANRLGSILGAVGSVVGFTAGFVGTGFNPMGGMAGARLGGAAGKAAAGGIK